MTSASELRLQIESTLAQRIPSALTPALKMIRPVAAIGIELLDDLLGVVYQSERSVNWSVLSVQDEPLLRFRFSHARHKLRRCARGSMCRMHLIPRQLPRPVLISHDCYGCAVACRRWIQHVGVATSFCLTATMPLHQ